MNFRRICIKKSKQSSSSVLKPSNSCSLEENFSDMKKCLPLIRNSESQITLSASPRQQLTRRDNKQEKQQWTPSPRATNKTGVKIRELKDDQEEEHYSSVSVTDVESGGPDLSDEFLINGFEDNDDDDLLSQLWNSCKREDLLLDDVDSVSKQQGSAGPTSTTAVIYVNRIINNSKKVAQKAKPVKSKENRPTKKLSSIKKSKVRQAQIVSEFMKKREDGWRD
ncbi:hypothetical protein R1sor_012955 [Riccia sorocarpa]|uniref:Uncharacterized protein n=1 Tax=Riccia sorocarpa TaxID=122646 RepID=A0ABD3I8N3_9MARC